MEAVNHTCADVVQLAAPLQQIPHLVELIIRCVCLPRSLRTTIKDEVKIVQLGFDSRENTGFASTPHVKLIIPIGTHGDSEKVDSPK